MKSNQSLNLSKGEGKTEPKLSRDTFSPLTKVNNSVYFDYIISVSNYQEQKEKLSLNELDISSLLTKVDQSVYFDDMVSLSNYQ